MDPGDSSQSPGRSFFDAASLLGPPFTTASASASRSSPYVHLAHIPSAFSMLGRPAFPAIPPFGGLGTLGDGLPSPLRSPGGLGHSLSPTTGGAEWWRAASEHARRLAGCPVGVDYFAGSLASMSPTYNPYSRPGDTSPTAFDLLHQSQAQKSLNGAFAGAMFQPSFRSLAAGTTAATTTTTTVSSPAKSSPSKSSSSSSHSASKSNHTNKTISESGKSRTDSPKTSSASVTAKTTVSLNTSTSTVTTTTTASSGNGTMVTMSTSPRVKKKSLASVIAHATALATSAMAQTTPTSALPPSTKPGLPAPPALVPITPKEHKQKKKPTGDGDSSDDSDDQSDVSSGSSLSSGELPSASDSEDDKKLSQVKEREQIKLKLQLQEKDKVKVKVHKEKVKDTGQIKENSTHVKPKMKKLNDNKEPPRSTGHSILDLSKGSSLLDTHSIAHAHMLNSSPKQHFVSQLLHHHAAVTNAAKQLPMSLLTGKPAKLDCLGLTYPAPTTGRGRGRNRGRARVRGRGRGSSSASRVSSIDVEDQRRAQQQLKVQLEAQLKQQQQQLKMLRKAQAQKEKEAAIKAQQSSVVSVKAHQGSAAAQLSQHADKVKLQQSKLAQALLGQQGQGQSLQSNSLGSEPLVAKFKTLSDVSSESNEDTDSSESESGSDSDDESSASESESETSSSEQGPSARDSESSAPGSKGDKRSADGNTEGSPRKRRRTILDETEIRIPLEHGWRRQTRIRTVGQRGIVGEVLYFGPCGKKLRSYPEVVRYLTKNNITDLTRDNFTFSTKIGVGEFLEARHGEGENGLVLLSEQEVLDRLMAAQTRKLKQMQKKEERQARQARKRQAQEMAKVATQVKIRKKMETQGCASAALEMARRAQEIKFKKKIEKDQAKRAKQMRLLEAKKMKEQQKLARQQEKLQRQEQIRLEREMRAQQIVEEREIKRQQAVMLKEQERERRRQHMLLVKALEARKKQEEKERTKIEKRNEKLMSKERKMEQKRMEIQMAREMKQPIEDMQLGDQKPLPTLNRIPGVRLAGQAFADCLMVIEFLHNFGEALGFDVDSIPTLNILQSALMNEEDYVDELIQVTIHLLRFALEDPGVPNPKEVVTDLGQKIVEVEIKETNLSEVLRLFIIARNGGQDEMSDSLTERPLEALNPTNKIAVVAYLCNELLTSKVISSEIDKNIESMANIRRDKWVVEGKLRNLKTVQAKKFNRPVPKPQPSDNTEGGDNEDSNSVAPSIAPPGSKKGSDDEEENESGNESDVTNATGNVSDTEDDNGSITAEELDKKVDKLTKQHSQFRDKVFRASHKLRAMCFGQDRYQRRYWVLPHAGGIYVEGMESAEIENELEIEVKQENETEEKDEKEKEECVKEENGEKSCKDEFEGMEGVEKIKEEPMEEVKEECKVESNGLDLEHSTSPSTSGTSAAIKAEDATATVNGTASDYSAFKDSDKDKNTNLFLQKPEDNSKFGELIGGCKEEKSNGEAKVTETFNHAHSHNSLKPNSTGGHESHSAFRSVDSLLGSDSKSNPAVSLFPNHYMTSSPGTMSFSPLSAEQMLKNLSTGISSQNPWFSILPRMPCDEASLTRSHTSTPMNATSPKLPKPFLSPVPYGTFSFHSPMFASFQMGQLRGTPSDFSISNLSQSSAASPYNSMQGGLSATPSLSQGPHSSGASTPGPSTPAPSTPKLLKNVDTDLPEPVPIPMEMQRGWWRISDPDQLRTVIKCLHSRGIRERNMQKTLQKYVDYACSACKTEAKEATGLEVRDTDREISQNGYGAPDPDDDDIWMPEACDTAELNIVDEVETLEDRVFSASLQGWKLPQKITEDEDVELVGRSVKVLNENEQYAFEKAKERLLSLESNIERRYLKAPLSKVMPIKLPPTGNNGSNNNEDSPPSSPASDDSGDLPAGLVAWRKGVEEAVSVAQLSLCMIQLVSSISWEKSIMKVSCQICCKDDNEAELLLCDGCDKGYHTYCFKPKMEDIPDGDWYCYECVSKATGQKHCVVCGKKTGKLAECDKCPRAFHQDCLIPPLPRIPRKWTCLACLIEKGKGKSRSRKSKELREREKEIEAYRAELPSGDKHKNCISGGSDNGDNSDELNKCRALLTEMERHEDSWPFLAPVNLKQFPQYRKLIKHPMDFQTMRQKLRDFVYKSHTEFAQDARLVFNNCQTFNEDESEIGQAGHNMRRFFEKKWKDIGSNAGR